MKKYLMTGIAALTLCAGFTSCSHDFEPMTQEEIDKAKYDQAFLKYVGGKIAADQDWGFGSALTRAADGVWNDTHATTHDWESELTNLPTEAQLKADGAIDLTSSPKQGSVYYIPSTWTKDKGAIDVNWQVKLTGGAKLYNFGHVTEIKQLNFEGTVNIYNVGTFDYNITSGNINIINTGILNVIHTGNVYDIYNSGDITFAGGDIKEIWEYPEWNNWAGVLVGTTQAGADLHTKMSIYSTDEGKIELPAGADFKATCHIDGMVYTYGDIHFQNTECPKYICGIVSVADKDDNRHDLNIDADVTTSYILTNNILLNGDNIFLTAGGYIKANKISTEGNGKTNANGYYEAIVTEANKTAMVDVNEFYMKNDKLGNHMGAGVYANFSTITYKEGGLAQTATAANYTSDALFAQSRINNSEIGGTSKCGGTWGKPTTEKYDLRIIAEDLTVSGDNDFDFNDVVFDVKYGSPVKIKLLAAGGTLPLYVGGHEVHSEFGVEGTDVMINTNAGTYGTAADKAPVEFELTNVSVNSPEEANERIEIVVVKHINGQEVRETLTAEPGKPAAKIAVGIDYNWLDERVSIKEAYSSFTDWVNGTFKSAKWWE